jgi:predicted nuclease of predicted toxin-antitoxin system
MKWLADENVPRAVLRRLRDLGQDVMGVAETAAGSDDRSVFAWARREGRVLLTFDKDFGELFEATPLQNPSGLVLLRMAMSPPGDIADWIVRILTSRDDWGGCFSVIERDRIRMRRLPTRG